MGFFCAQLIAAVLSDIGILPLSGYVKTDGYPNKWCCCCCKPTYSKKIKEIRIPKPYQMTVKILHDILISRVKGIVHLSDKNMTHYKTGKKSK